MTAKLVAIHVPERAIRRSVCCKAIVLGRLTPSESIVPIALRMQDVA
jgi:hypothetical protein